MPDITMCDGKDCPLKENCYRHTAEPSKFAQSYYATPPWDGEKCDRYVPKETK